jgi:lipopolysaccharide/colanic/teichoic acid biosynthesis glycosyltransferase
VIGSPLPAVTDIVSHLPELIMNRLSPAHAEVNSGLGAVPETRRGDTVGMTIDDRSLRTAVESVAAAFLLILALPVLAAAALLIKLTSTGPVIYTQNRIGQNGRRFTIYKLRTMHHNCEAHSGVRWAIKGDLRITRVGKLLRATHIDELPQLINVIRGEMSLIGPRPERPEIVAKLVTALPGYEHRHRVRPGVTGLAQIQLPPDTDLESVRRKLALDLIYIQEQTLWLDARIVLGTLLKVVAIPFAWIRFTLHLPAAQADAVRPQATRSDDTVCECPSLKAGTSAASETVVEIPRLERLVPAT